MIEMNMTPLSAAQERTLEHAVDAAHAREQAMVDAIDELCRRFDPFTPEGEVVTPKTAKAYADLARISDALQA